ncbi:MAG: CotH kinase family protein [Prevotellaceae bacterium]|jgi:hypothetical protein|nr:CotH kinase family protein [Prevotellaceae bacterium]
MSKLYLGTITLFGALSLCSLRAAIILNEIMPCNISTVMNGFQNYTGWAEIYNNGQSSVNLKGYTFENVYKNTETGKNDTLRWTVKGDVNVSADGYKLIFFDDNANEAVDHAPFKMETEGGLLRLLDNTQTKVDELGYQRMVAHVSWGKYGAEQGYLVNPTPKKANAPSLGTTLRRVQKPAFGRPPGFYDGAITVSLQSESNAVIYYTTDGSEPTKESTPYTQPVSVSKTTVIRARAYMDNRILSDIAAGTYIFAEDAEGNNYHLSCNGFTVPVVSISTDPDNFFGDQMGIYVKGTNGIAGPSCDPSPANYRQDWKRPIHFEYFLGKQQVISQELDAAVMGGCSRQYEQKSLKITASNKLGNNKIAGIDGVSFDFFPEKKTEKDYKGIMLRNGGNDYYGTRTRDAFMQSLIEGRMNVDYQAFQPVAFYINGEYWGHMTLMERHNKDFVYTNFGLKDEEIDVLEISSDGVNVTEGDKEAYDRMIAESGNNPTAEDYYGRMNRLIDIDEYVDYQIFEQFIGNTDWPSNNMKLWREKNTGRFRWIALDTDFGFGLYDAGYPNYCDVNLNMIDYCLRQGSQVPPNHWGIKDAKDKDGNIIHNPVELFSNLMKNDTFRKRFLNRYILHLGTTFVPERMIGILEKVREDAKNEICAHWERFYGDPYAIPNNSMTTFANERPEKVYGHLSNYFKLGSLVNLQISSNISDADFIINGERLNTSEYEGKYYKDLDLNVQPVAPAGYKFVSWNQSFGIKMLDSNSEWKYYYSGNQPEGNWYANSYDDSEWDAGKGKFGYADDRTYDVKLGFGEDPRNKYLTAYFRTSFEIDNLSAINEIQADMIYDDAFVLYINGKEFKRDNMPEGDVSYETLALEYSNDKEISFTIDKSYLQNGKNVIAVEIHQNEPTSSDLTFKLSVDAKSNNTGSSSNQAYNAKMTGNMNLIATFEKTPYEKPALFINELCASNGPKSGYHDGYGTFGDWIEIYNAGDVAVDLAGMYLEENKKKITYQFPSYNPFETTVPAGGYKIVWASKLMAQGSLHANFKLTAGEASTLVLYQMVNGERKEIDDVSYPKEVGSRNESYGRFTDGSSDWVFFNFCEDEQKYLATPEKANGTEECVPRVSVKELTSDTKVAMKLYPNPAKTFLNVDINTHDAYALQVYDDKGRLIEHLTVNEDIVTLNLQQYPPGVYIVKAVTGEAVLQQKFIKY